MATTCDKTCLYVCAYEHANKQQQSVLDYYFAHQDFDCEEKVLEVMKVYHAIGVKESCIQMMSDNHTLALGYLNEVCLPKERKSILVEFIEILMSRKK